MFSKKGRYALRAMLDLAEHNTNEYITLKEIADRQEISEKYLESILPALAKNGFLDGLRGKGGGYKLIRAPETYTVGSILDLFDNSVSCRTSLAFFRENPCKNAVFLRKLFNN